MWFTKSITEAIHFNHFKISKLESTQLYMGFNKEEKTVTTVSSLSEKNLLTKPAHEKVTPLLN